MARRRGHRGCDRCKMEGAWSRYRPLIDRWLCGPCYPLVLQEVAAAQAQMYRTEESCAHE